MLAFLHNVLYIAIPKIKIAKATKGIKMKILVFRPIIKTKSMPIKLSHLFHYNSKGPFCFWILQ